MATHCQGLPLQVSLYVDKYTTIPTFLTMSSTSTDVTLYMNPTDSDAGSYTVRIKFAVIDFPNLFVT